MQCARQNTHVTYSGQGLLKQRTVQPTCQACEVLDRVQPSHGEQQRLRPVNQLTHSAVRLFFAVQELLNLRVDVGQAACKNKQQRLYKLLDAAYR